MSKFPAAPGAHQIDFLKFAEELYKIEKEVMASSEHLYQFQSFDEFLKCFTVDHEGQVYIWNTDKGEIAGFFIHEKLSDQKDELILIALRPQFQGQGIGRKFMDFYFSLFPKGTVCILSTNKKNLGAIKFHESHGYKYVKDIPNQYHDGETRALMQKQL